MTTIEDTLAERGTRYGEFKGNAEIAQGIKAVLFNTKPNLELAADQREALDMIAHKLARIINGDPNYIDSWVDIAGYATLVGQRLQSESEAKRLDDQLAKAAKEIRKDMSHIDRVGQNGMFVDTYDTDSYSPHTVVLRR